MEDVLFSAGSGDVGGLISAGTRSGHWNPQELGVLDDLHSSALYVQKSVSGLLPPDVDNDFLFLPHSGPEC